MARMLRKYDILILFIAFVYILYLWKKINRCNLKVHYQNYKMGERRAVAVSRCTNTSVPNGGDVLGRAAEMPLGLFVPGAPVRPVQPGPLQLLLPMGTFRLRRFRRA